MVELTDFGLSGHKRKLTHDCVSGCSPFLSLTIAASAAGISPEQINRALESRICPVPPETVHDIILKEVCRDFSNSSASEYISCSQGVARQNDQIHKYNDLCGIAEMEVISLDLPPLLWRRLDDLI